jgi:hypothetical protein
MPILKPKPKKLFDINDAKDLNLFSNFYKKSSWGVNGCPFLLEEPWSNVPDMIKDKVIKKFLGIKQ